MMSTDCLVFHLFFSCGCCPYKPILQFPTSACAKSRIQLLRYNEGLRSLSSQQANKAFQKVGSTKGCLLFYLPQANRELHKDENYMDGINNGIEAFSE